MTDPSGAAVPSARLSAGPDAARKPRIVLDAIGGRNAPAAVVDGAVRAATEAGLPVALVGDTILITRELSRFETNHLDIALHHAPPPIDYDDRAASRFVLDKCCELIAAGECAALVSAGRSYIIREAVSQRLGLLPGVARPGKLTVLPSQHSDRVILDVGSSEAACGAGDIVSYALLGETYYRVLYNKALPTVGLLADNADVISSALHREAHEKLRHAGINYLGVVRGYDLFNEGIDVIVTDGFTGNIAMAAVEATIDFMAVTQGGVQERRGLMNAFRAAFTQSAARDFHRRLDSRQLGGAPLLGVNGVVVVAQTSSDARAIHHAVVAAAHLVENSVLPAVTARLRGVGPTVA